MRARSILVAALALAACPARKPAAPLKLEPCRIRGVSEEVRCATLEVPENRAQPGARKIPLRVAVVPALHQCLDRYAREGSDVRLYGTSIAMDDLDEVRAGLGYPKINLWGASYGTRAALVYLRQHGDHVRAMVIDGVAPPQDSLMLTA